MSEEKDAPFLGWKEFNSMQQRIAELEAQLAELKKQEPVAWYARINNEWDSFTREKPPEDAYDEGTLQPLYAAPVVQPDMVLVPREPTEAMLDAVIDERMEALATGKDHNLLDIYRAMIAAAEKEQK